MQERRRPDTGSGFRAGRSLVMATWAALVVCLAPAIAGAAPVITGISPSRAPAGVSTSVTITGTGLSQPLSILTMPAGLLVSQIGGNGSTTVTATFQTASRASGPFSVRVISATGISNPLTFTVGAITPTLTSLNPSVTTAGSAGLTLAVDGTDFYPGTTLRFGTTPLATTVVSNTRLSAPVPASLLSEVGTVSVTGVTATGVVTNALPFSIVPRPVPVITGLNPPSTLAGGSDLNLLVTGANFQPRAEVRFNGTPLATEFVNTATLSAVIPAALIALAGHATVSVANPDGTTSASVGFAIEPARCVVPEGRIFFSRDGALWSTNPDGSDARMLVPAGDAPKLSPDHRWIVFYSHVDQQIYVVDSTGANLVRLSPGGYFDQFPAWSPDGSKIVFQRYMNYPRDRRLFIWTVDMSGLVPTVMTETQLTDGTDGGEYPVFADGATVLYAASTSLKTVSASGGSTSVLMNTGSLVVSAPTVGATGVIAFTGTVPGTEAQLYAYSPWTRAVTALTSPARGDASARTPAYSPDGTRLVFSSTRTGTAQLFTMAADGTGPRTNISNSSTSDVAPAWK